MTEPMTVPTLVDAPVTGQSLSPPLATPSTSITPTDDAQQSITQARTLIDAWWYPTTELSYGQLATDLSDRGLITGRMAATWNQTPTARVFVLKDLRVVEIKEVYQDDKAATVEIVAEDKAFPLEYRSTFLEFAKSGGEFKLDEVK